MAKMMKQQGLYNPAFEHDACGVGFVADIAGNRSHQMVLDGIQILKNLVHRGAVGGDSKTGDGAGIIVQLPHNYFSAQCKLLSITLPEAGYYAIGMVFLPRDTAKRDEAMAFTERIVEKEQGSFLGWRDVPVRPDCLGEIARESRPHIAQFFVSIDTLSGDVLERKMYVLRRCLENEALSRGMEVEDFYIASLSNKLITYKGMFVAPQLEEFYPDLIDPGFVTSLALVHQRYSTNTFPSWPLAHPFRFLAHNGEINTLRGNINKMRARENTISSPHFGDDIKKLLPIANPRLSDSAILDNGLELLTLGGRSIEHAMCMMIPEAFGDKYHISRDKRAFYEYHAAIMEPWDGPAAVAFTDGVKVGAVLDRNGLRPARYVVTKDGRVVLASEVGVIDIAPEQVLHKGRLAPGKMLLVDQARKRIISDNEIKSTVSRARPYRRWLATTAIELKGLFETPGPVDFEKESLVVRQKAFGYSLEDLKMIIAPMAENAQEPVGSMGNDAPLAVLSERSPLFCNYFKQLFAQVTNPPIDPYRENLVMSLMNFVGREKNLLDETPQHCHQLKLPHPVLTNEDMNKLRKVDVDGLKAGTVSIFFGAADEDESLAAAAQRISREAEALVDGGCSLVVLTDRGVDEKRVPIPALLATAFVHHHLVKVGKRQLTALVIETGEAREIMHFATLVGYGASAINPYIAFETIADLHKDGKLKPGLELQNAFENYITAVKKGLLKVMSKMGVSTIRSYRGAQIFEAVGLNSKFIDKYFPGTPSRIEGIGITEIATESRNRHSTAFEAKLLEESALDSGGNIHYRSFSEKHIDTPEAIAAVHRAVRENDYKLYRKYAQGINDASRNLCTLRGLFIFKNRKPVPLEEVEPVVEIIKRFVSSAMSFGSISKEAHETIAIAMNRIGAMSNSGEGGEDEARYKPLPNGDLRTSMVKQVASGRFGVSSNYLVNARELQIKMAQGAKPGEGGQLPGHKVNDTIARVRNSTPGVMLISPPPHHDIYSIEDLAQLIFDLKNANPQARISVKLVAEAGVGTVAAGVAKGKADMVLISGHDGGTGASPISSIKHAGIPWEIGLAETQQTLVLNRLRERIRVQTDGKLKTGRDVVIAALLGAEEYGFGTLALIAMGCIMMRKCHLNTCPVGVASQDPELRKRFSGKPEYLINLMNFIAEDVREHMAMLGFRTMDDMVGRIDALDVNKAIDHWKAVKLDFSKVLAMPEVPPDGARRCVTVQEHDWSCSMDGDLVSQAKAALEEKQPVNLSASIRNCNRAVGATLSSHISSKYGSEGLPADTIKVKFSGSAGQSFGAFLAPGITFELEGDTNDYLGKGLSGGKLIVYPPRASTFRPERNIIAGNVNLFGAIGGTVFINGMAGERFAVRNSGATAVVEGVGDHGCEYMTGGRVIVLGRTGINFAAGMSGGIAYVLDDDQLFDTRCNLEMVDVEPVTAEEDQQFLYKVIQEHVHHTGSEQGKRILKEWVETLPQLVKVMPIDYRRALERMQIEEHKETESVAMTEEVYG
jgi:glutamate synthase (NADPH) large chain